MGKVKKHVTHETKRHPKRNNKAYIGAVMHYAHVKKRTGKGPPNKGRRKAR